MTDILDYIFKLAKIFGIIIIVFALANIYSNITYEKTLIRNNFTCTEYRWNYNPTELCIIDGELINMEVNASLPPEQICNGTPAINPNATYIPSCVNWRKK